MFRIIIKDLSIIIAVVILFILTLPILVGKIEEKKFPADSYTRIIDVLPENSTMVWSDNLPENETKKEYRKIEINLSEQKLYLIEYQDIIAEYPVSSGRPGMETPLGNFEIRNKFNRAWSKNYGLWMPYWMAFTPGGYMGIHELPEWPNGYKEGEDHLGQPVSHGCVRLGVGPAELVYNWVEIGTPVIITE